MIVEPNSHAHSLTQSIVQGPNLSQRYTIQANIVYSVIQIMNSSLFPFHGHYRLIIKHYIDS